MKKAIVALVAAVVLAFGTAAPAEAHSFGAQGPAHTHIGSCSASGVHGIPPTIPNSACVRYILANGAIIQASKAYMDSQKGYVLVFCSYQTATTGWQFNHYSYGPWGNDSDHPYCQSPTYNGSPWSIRN